MFDVLYGDYNPGFDHRNVHEVSACPGGRLPYTVYPAFYVDQINMTNMDMRASPGPMTSLLLIFHHLQAAHIVSTRASRCLSLGVRWDYYSPAPNLDRGPELHNILVPEHQCRPCW